MQWWCGKARTAVHRKQTVSGKPGTAKMFRGTGAAAQKGVHANSKTPQKKVQRRYTATHSRDMK
jgi:hypothetical protein